MRLLFLDFDGVLNSDVYFASPAFLAATAGRSDAEVMLLERSHHIDPTRIPMLNRLVAATGAEVVISSSWRLALSLDELNELLASLGATFRARAVTPRVTEYDPSRPLRAREILAFLASLDSPPEAVAALDDDDLASLVPGHVRPDGACGLQEHHVAACARLLTPPQAGDRRP